MRISIKPLLAVAAAGVLAAGCATGPYYQDYGYGYDTYGYGPAYYGPAYVGPSVGFGYSYYDYDDRRRYRGDRHWRGDRDGRRDSQPSIAPTPDSYRGPRNHAGEAIGPGYQGPPGSDSP
jgi:hypothetical protein